ncbi:MAG TPA: winged helix DNA-binding domain-containing protein, partial [Gemmatimonadales bacterium]|nr:winged helix DNA-binding domain-containing protein [Gemmatimonadales bacterium]
MPPSPAVLSLRQLNRATLARQGLLEPLPRRRPGELIRRIGSIQAQHPDWPPFALHARMAAASRAPNLRLARERREIVRASLMRLTVHIVAARDFWPMSTISLPFRRRQWRLLYKQDPETSALAQRISAAHGAVLDAMRDAPRAIHEIEDILAAELPGVKIPPNRCLWRHFSGAVQLIHAPHEGETYGRQRYLPAADWLGPPPEEALDPEYAAQRVAETYLGAFGPASVDDLVAYVGRGDSLRRWRRAVGALEDRLAHFTDDAGRALVDLADAPRPEEEAPAPPRLLARWDSLLLAYGTRDRTRVLPEEHRSTVITNNADVLPTFLVDGFVAGTWLPRRGQDGGVRVELRPFGRLRTVDREA